jgi:CCR4-NOT transcriptional regulation complex NOT5 subunit
VQVQVQQEELSVPVRFRLEFDRATKVLHREMGSEGKQLLERFDRRPAGPNRQAPMQRLHLNDADASFIGATVATASSSSSSSTSSSSSSSTSHQQSNTRMNMDNPNPNPNSTSTRIPSPSPIRSKSSNQLTAVLALRQRRQWHERTAWLNSSKAHMPALNPPGL